MKKLGLSGDSVNFRLSDQDRKTIDTIASNVGLSRSGVLRALVRAAERRQLTIDLIPQQQQAASNARK